MKCSHCAAEWQSTIEILFCPFCHSPLITVTEKFYDLESALLYLVKEYGTDIILNSKNVLWFIEYYLPDRKREYNFMNMVYAANIVNSLARSKTMPEVMQRNVIKQSIVLLKDKYGIASDWAEYVVGCICSCLEMENYINQSIIKLKQLAEGKDAVAQFELAERYRIGKGVERNIDKYLYWLRCSSENGSLAATFQLGRAMYEGANCVKNEDAGKELMMQAALQQDVDAICFLASEVKNLGSEIKDIEVLINKLIPDELSAQQLVNLSIFYGTRGFASYSIRKAIDFARNAYEKDEKIAWETYVSTLQSEPTNENIMLALKVLRETATNGNIEAAKTLGRRYEKDAMNESDMMTAIYWYRIAAEAGDVDIQVHLGELYEKGLGVKIDLESAIYWYQIAAHNGSEIAHNKVSYKSKDCIVSDLTVFLKMTLN